MLRFAPSPTGHMHLGNARMALFNVLLARKLALPVLLRFDDTDKLRSKREFEMSILEDLAFLDLSFEETFYQSHRLARYQECFEELKSLGYLYPCFESLEQLTFLRKQQQNQKRPPIYNEEIQSKLASFGIQTDLSNTPYWRFRMPNTSTEFTDSIKGSIKIQHSTFSDPVILREDGTFLYNFCSLIDDLDYKVSHLLRGDDHITNTVVQIQIAKALNKPFAGTLAHFPMFKTQDHSKMSKRTGGEGDFTIRSLRSQLIEPMTINSLLVNLGTNNTQQIYYNLNDIFFELAKYSPAQPILDVKDIFRLNKLYYSDMDYAHLSFEDQACISKQAFDVLKFGVANLTELYELNTIIKELPEISGPVEATYLPIFAEIAASLPSIWDPLHLKIWLKEEVKPRIKLQELRKYLTGKTSGPELAELIALINRDKFLRKLAPNHL